MTIGKSLAHGLSKRNLRELFEIDNEKYIRTVKRNHPGKFKRAALFRAERQSLLDMYQDQMLCLWEDGEMSGKDKNAVFTFIAWIVTETKPDHEKYLSIEGCKLTARTLDVFQFQIAVVNNHAIARMLQTFSVKTIEELMTKLKKQFSLIFSIHIEFRKTDPSQYEAMAILHEEGIIICEFDVRDDLLFIRTAISLNSLNTGKRKFVLDHIAKESYAIPWRTKERTY